MPIYSFLTGSYAREIYLYGNRTFANINQAYVDAVKQYAADTYSVNLIANALTNGWISQLEYDETIALKGPEDPQIMAE